MKITLKIDTSNVSEIKEALLFLGNLGGVKAKDLAVATKKVVRATKKVDPPTTLAEQNTEDSNTYTIGDAQTLVSEKVAEHRVEIRAKMKSLGVDKVSKLKGEFKARLPEFIEFLKAL